MDDVPARNAPGAFAGLDWVFQATSARFETSSQRGSSSLDAVRDTGSIISRWLVLILFLSRCLPLASGVRTLPRMRYAGWSYSPSIEGV